MIERFSRPHNGVTYAGVNDRQNVVVGSITKGNKKWTIKGFPEIKRTLGSYKHGKEVQIALWNKAGSTFEQDRVIYAKDWDRLEIFFPPDLWHQLIKEYVLFMKELEK